MQRRLNKKLSDNLRHRDRSGGGGHKKDKPHRNKERTASPPTGSETALPPPPPRKRDTEYDQVDEDEDDNDAGDDNASLMTNSMTYPRSPDLLPLDDREFEQEFGQELLDKVFHDADRGSQHDLPQRNSKSRGGVEVQFLNERMAAFLPGMDSSDSQLRKEDDQVPRSRASSRGSSLSTRAKNSGTVSPSKSRRISPSRSAAVSKGFIVSEINDEEEPPAGGWSQGQTYYYEAAAPGASKGKQNVYEIEEEEEEIIAPGSKTKSNDNFNYPSPEQDEEDDEYEDEDVGPFPPPVQRSKSSLYSKKQTSSKRISNNNRRRESSDSLRNTSMASLLGDSSRTRLGRSASFDRGGGSASSLRSTSRDSFGRRAASRKFNEDLIGAESALQNDIEVGYQRSSPRLGGGGRSSGSRRSFSREVTALPIEIPDSVTDEATFRRYLSVRRGAHIETRLHIEFEDFANKQNSYESVGAGGPSRVPPSMAVNKASAASARAEANRKSSCLCFAIVSLALLSASASQLRYVVAYSKAHAYPALNYFLICVSILIEIVAGVGYVIISRMPATDTRVDNVVGVLIAGLFVVAINNVIISAFAFDDHVCEVLAKKTGMLDVIDQSPKQNIMQTDLSNK